MALDFRTSPRVLLESLALWGLVLLSPAAAAAQGSVGQDARTAETVVRELYDFVTFPAGATPDFEELRAFFLPEAVVVLRTSSTASTVFSVDGFVEDWLRFSGEANLSETGFTERIIRTHVTEMGDIAHIWVLYEAEIPGWDRPPQPGVDSFQLVKRPDGWKIASIVNEVPTPGRPVPEALRGGV